MKSIQKISVLTVLVASVVALAAVAHGAQVGPKKAAVVPPIHTNVRGEVSGLNSSKFNLTTEDGVVYSVSMAPMLQKLADKKAKVEAAMERRKVAMAAQLAKHPELAKAAAISTPRAPLQDPNDPANLKDGITVVVTIEGAVSGTTLSAISVHPIPMHKRPELLPPVKKPRMTLPVVPPNATTTPARDESRKKDEKGTTTDPSARSTPTTIPPNATSTPAEDESGSDNPIVIPPDATSTPAQDESNNNNQNGATTDQGVSSTTSD